MDLFCDLEFMFITLGKKLRWLDSLSKFTIPFLIHKYRKPKPHNGKIKNPELFFIRTYTVGD